MAKCVIYFLFILVEICSKRTLVGATSCPPSPQSPRAATRLRQNLFCDYDRLSRPVKNYNDSVPLNVILDIHHIDMDEHKERMEVEGVFRFMWTDQYLSWSPWEYDDISYLQVGPLEIWAPDLTLNLMNMVGLEELKPTSCVLSYSGIVLCLQKTTVYAPCQQDMHHWPYDVHNCSFLLSSYMYYEKQLNFTNLEIETESIQQNRAWELGSYSAVRKRMNIMSVKEPVFYPYTQASFIIRRHSGFFASATVIPGCVMLTVILCTFWLGPMTHARIYMGGFMMMGCCYFLSYLLYLIPPNGDEVPVIVTLFRDCMGLAAFSTIIASVVEIMHKSERRPPVIVSSIINWIELSFVGRLLLITDAPTAREDEASIVELSTSKQSPWATFAIALDRLAFLLSLLVTAVLLIGYIP